MRQIYFNLRDMSGCMVLNVDNDALPQSSTTSSHSPTGPVDISISRRGTGGGVSPRILSGGHQCKTS